MSRPLLLGHRGLRTRQGPVENSCRAFDAALQAGCDGFEFDVRLTLDGIPVICHDPDHDGRRIANCSAEDLALPQLHSILSGYGSRAFLDIELKVPGLEKKAIEAIADSGTTYDRLVVSSFLPAVLQESRELDSALPLGFLCDESTALPLWRDLPIDYVIVHHRLVTADLVEVVHSAGKKLFTWTVNRPEDMLRLAKWSVDGIISDDPSVLVSTLRSFSR